jgi:hypothetical protein
MSVSAQIIAILMMSDAATAVATAPAKPDPLDKVVCQRNVETGSLVRGKKDCRTRREWAALSAASRRDVDTLRDRSGPRSTNGSDFTPF